MPKRFSALLLCFIAGTLHAQYGSLDPTFGDGGLVFTQPMSNGHYEGFDVAVQPDGKILATGVAAESDSRLAVFRYLSDGNLDLTFGDSGIARLTVPHFSSWGYRFALQPDGKIVVAGIITEYSFSMEDMVLVRFMPDGQLDVSFGNGGFATTNLWGPREWPLGIAVQPDGNISVAGFLYDTMYAPHAFLARYKPDGEPDLTFGANGLVLPTKTEALNAGVSAVLFHENKILMAIQNYLQPNDFVIIRLNADGSSDPTFGDDGVVQYDFGTSERATSIAVQPDGKIVVAGDSEQGDAIIAGIIRLLPDGRLDTDFGDGGIALIDTDFAPCDPGEVVLQPDGKIVMSLILSIGSNDDFGLMRLLANGEPDPTFGNSGVVSTTFNAVSYDLGLAVALQPDHKIIIAGYSSTGPDYGLALARYLSNYAPVIPPPSDSGAVQTKIKVYPNPSSGDITLEYELSRDVNVWLDLYDVQGRLVQNIFSPALRKTGFYIEPLFLSDYVATGAYFLALHIGGVFHYIPIIVQ